MEGNQQPTDYAAILADMEAKYTALGNAIASLRVAVAAGALGVLGEISGAPPVGVQPLSGSISLPRGAFLGKTVTEAIKLYLSALRKKQTNKEIAQALKDGGLESTGNFDNLVTSGLFRLKQDGTVLRFDDGWGLAEWYPESFRNRVAQEKPKNSEKKGSKKPARKAKAPEAKTSSKVPKAKAGGLEQQIEAILRSEPSRVFLSRGIAETLGVNSGAVSLSLGRMATKRKAEKRQNGYRAFSGNVKEMPTAAKVS